MYSTKGAVASSQPLASSIGQQILSDGGNAADACVAMAAVMLETCQFAFDVDSSAA